MIDRDSNFDTAVIANIRKPKARLTITWSDPYVDTGLTITPNEDNNVSDELHTADTITTTNYKWFLLQGNSTLDESYKLFPTPHQTAYQVGWYGSSASDVNGEFSPWDPTLTLTFPDKPIIGLTVAFENVLNEYAVDFTIDIMSGSTYLDVVFITGNTNVYWVGEPNVSITSANKLILNIEKWSSPGATVKVLEFYDSISRQYTGDVIKSISLLEEREIRDSSNPISNMSSSELSVELQNINVDNVIDPFFPGNTNSYYYQLLKPGRRISLELGFQHTDGNIYYVNKGVYWSGDFTIKDSASTMTFTARDRMEKLRKAVYDDNELKSNDNFYNLITYVCFSAIDKITNLIYEIDPLLASLEIPVSYVERTNYFDVIKDIMGACGGQAYISNEDKLIFESAAKCNDYSGSPDLFITKSEYFTKDQPAHYEDIINTIEIETQPHVLNTTTQDIYTSDEEISIGASATLDPMELKYSSFPVDQSSLNISLSDTGCSTTWSAEYYSWGLTLTVSNTIATAGTFTIKITGKIYEVTGGIVSTASDSNSIIEHGVLSKRLSNYHLLQDSNTAQSIADDLIDFYKDPRNDLILTWRGNPALELGDIIVVPEYQRGAVDVKARFKVYKLQTNFDGTLKQTISARRIDVYTP